VSKYQHRYPVQCPKCNADLTVERAVVIHFIIADHHGDVSSREGLQAELPPAVPPLEPFEIVAD
jgi:hypothetical protein